jgi:hypothetical protein
VPSNIANSPSAVVPWHNHAKRPPGARQATVLHEPHGGCGEREQSETVSRGLPLGIFARVEEERKKGRMDETLGTSSSDGGRACSAPTGSAVAGIEISAPEALGKEKRGWLSLVYLAPCLIAVDQ